MIAPSDIRELQGHVCYPLPPTAFDRYAKDMDVYVRFMRHLRQSAYTRAEQKILSAIQYTADMTDYSDADVARILVDLGLRASRYAFPAEFLNAIDATLLREREGALASSICSLRAHWDWMDRVERPQKPLLSAPFQAEQALSATMVHA